MTFAVASKSAYGEIARTFALFGGVQVFNIIVQVIRSKFIAMLLGPAGMGIVGLLNSTIGLVSALTSFGLRTSAVRSIAVSSSTGDLAAVAQSVIVLRRWVWVTGLLGALITAGFARTLSLVTFGSDEFTGHFAWVSISLLFTQLSSGQAALLQGMKSLRALAYASLAGSVLSLVTAIPLYYLYGVDGIVPAIMATAFTALASTWYYARKIKVERKPVSVMTTLSAGKDMVTMGIALSASGLITIGVSYTVRVYVGHLGGLEQVGLYSAGFAIIYSYFDLIFSSMATEYFPRLSSVASDDSLCRRNINQQAEILVLVLSPILAIFIVYINLIIVLLYSKEFLDVGPMMHWAALGIFFKAASWSIAFAFLAKGMSRIFFFNELATNSYMLLLNLAGYRLWGLAGLGISFSVAYVCYLTQVYIIARRKFRFTFKQEFFKIFIVQFLISVTCFATISVLHEPFNYLLGTLLLLISAVYSFVELRKREVFNALFAGRTSI